MNLKAGIVCFLSLSSGLMVGYTSVHDDLYEYQQTCFAYGSSYGAEGFSNCLREQQKMDRKDNFFIVRDTRTM